MTSPSAVQEALHLPEILQLFCDALLPDHDPSSSELWLPRPQPGASRDLLSVALTSRALCEPALNSLWRTIYSFDPIIACMPDDLFYWVLVSGGRAMYLNRSVVPSDVQRYKTYYAHRIRAVCLGGWNSPLFSLEVFQALQMEIGPEYGAFSPRLISFRWSANHPLGRWSDGGGFDQLYSMITAFVGKDVETLVFHLTEDKSIQTTAIWSVARRLPNLKKLHITPPDSAYHSDKHMNCSASWCSLSDLHISITDSAVMRLASLPNLTRLHVIYNHNLPLIPPAGTFDCSSGPKFPSIQTLEVESDTLPSITAFLRYLPRKNSIRWLQCKTDAISSYPESRGLLQLVESRCNADTLQQLFIIDNYRQAEDEIRYDRIDVSGLFKFKTLVNLIVDLSGGLWLTSEETRRMAKAWPTIETLRLDTANRRIPQIDHKDLLHIAYSCPRLKYLSLPFDATKVIGAERHLSPGKDRVPALTELDPGDSPISSTSRVIQLLTVHCPNLKGVNSRYNGLGEEYEEQWDVVNDHF